DNIAMTLYFVGMWGVGTIHAFLLRKEVFRPAASPPVFTTPPEWNPWATAAPDGIGQYLLLQRLGEGGQGTVYLGQHPYGSVTTGRADPWNGRWPRMARTTRVACSGWPSRPPPRSTPSTRQGSSTATSNPPTSCSAPTAPGSSTSASPRPSTRLI